MINYYSNLNNGIVSKRTLTGKVARLPRVIRNFVNLMIYLGARYDQIIATLTELGYPGMFSQNISRWKERGYPRWLRCQRYLTSDLVTEQQRAAVLAGMATRYAAEVANHQAKRATVVQNPLGRPGPSA